MRIWLLALASCWTGPVAPAPVTTMAPAAPVVTRPALEPGGYFVQDLIAHRLETHAFEDVDQLGGELAVLRPAGLEHVPMPAPLQSRAIMIGLIRLDGFSVSPVSSAVGSDVHSVVEYCIDVTGRVTSAHLSPQGLVPPLRGATTPSDHEVLKRLRGWLFTPYFVDGKPVMACSFIDYAAIAP